MIRLNRLTTGKGRKVRKTARWVVSVFWLVQFVELTFVAFIQGARFTVTLLPERLIVVGLGMLLTLLLIEIALKLEGQPFRRRLILTFGSALTLCAILVMLAYQVAWLPIWGRPRPDLIGFVYTGFAWSWFFLSVAAALLALSYSIEVRAGGERLASLEIVARDARLAALRYQLNPHFLFNTLNSIAGLVGQGEPARAEAMVENLADFLEATLELDPAREIELCGEMALQDLYLAIEQVRFPERLRREYHIPAELGTAQVPALITQPLIENAIVHAVARSTGIVTLRIAAAAENGWLSLTVEDDGGLRTRAVTAGHGIGLVNIRERLLAHFGEQQSMTSEALPHGGYRTVLRFPLRLT